MAVTNKSGLDTFLGSLLPTKSVDDLPTDAQTLFGFLALVVDIRYRNKYGKPFEAQRGKGYTKEVQSNKVLADQVSPVDEGLLGL